MAADEGSLQRDGPVEDNSLGRLLTLSDGVFAIAMTLLALDLRVPHVDAPVTEHALVHALNQHWATYLSYLLSFYVLASYWLRHRGVMRSVVRVSPKLVARTLTLLLLIGAMPFFATLLGEHGSLPIALALYGAENLLATLVLIDLARVAARDRLHDPDARSRASFGSRWDRWWNAVVFALCIPGAFVLGRHGPYLLFLFLVPNLAQAAFRVRRARLA